MFEWKETFNTGDQKIDDQHKSLFAIINHLGDDIKEGKAVERLGNAINSLESYCQMHFMYEENCMFKHKCPIAKDNEAAHQKFIQALKIFEERFKDKGPSVDLADQLYTMCGNWLTNHICKIDTQLKYHLKINEL